jgi:histidinol-phosphate aminotransferase
MDLTAFIRPEVLALKGYHLKQDYPWNEVVKLNQNELPYAPHPSLVDLQKKWQEASNADVKGCWDINRYPNQTAYPLREALSQKLGWPAEGIALANGSNVLVQALVLATAVGGTVLTVRPTFSLYALEAKLFARELVEVPLKGDFSLDEELMISSLQEKKPNIIFLTNPNAPTGNLLDERILLRIIMEARCLVVLDEAYWPFSEKTFFDSLEENKNLLIMRTFSKAMGLAGLRLGYLLGAPEIIEQVEKILMPYRLPSLVQELCLFVLQNSQNKAKRVQEIRRETKRVFAFLKEFKGIHPFPTNANYILFRIDSGKSGTEVIRGLEEQNILIRDFSHYPGLDNCLRVSIGTVSENDRFMQGLERVFHG